MSYYDLSLKLVSLLGGSNNIHRMSHCITRLRFVLKNDSLADLVAIEKLNGILSVQIRNGEIQVITGNSSEDIYNDIISNFGNFDTKNYQNIKRSVSFKNMTEGLLHALSSILILSITPLVGGGMLKGFLYLFSAAGLLEQTGDTYKILYIASDCMFYFYPFLLALSSARYFKTNEYIAISLAGALFYPDIIYGIGYTAKFAGFLPIPYINYASSVIPIIFSVWLLSIIYRWVEKIIPGSIKLIAAPLIALVIVIPLQLAVFAPAGYYVGEFIAAGLRSVTNSVPWLAGFLVGASRPLLVLAGIHNALRPLIIQEVAVYGYSYIYGPIFISTMAQSAACLGVFISSSSARLRQISLSASLSAFLGITEPALYGVLAVHRKSLIAAMAGGGVGGAIIMYGGVKAHAASMASILSLPVFFGDGFLWLITGFFVTFIISMFSSAILCSKYRASAVQNGISGDNVSDDNVAHKVKIERGDDMFISLYSPSEGELYPLEDVKNNTFASKVLGDGIAIKPVNGKVYSPCNGEVDTIFPTRHAIAIKSEDNVEILIHAGINTVKFKGKNFKSFFNPGDIIKKGDLILEFDLGEVQKAGFDDSIIMLVVNSGKYRDIIKKEKGNTDINSKVIELLL